MKRRNTEFPKLRRPLKRNKIAEGMCGSNTFVNMKYLVIWAIVITIDFMLDFRFEFLWPFWLLLQSVYDSFKFKGLAFTILFVCIAITSDLMCLFFLPVNWLFFLASTYVWVQYVWQADKGFCWPTLLLWAVFLYMEGAFRWRDEKSIPHVDLCRPFAAHCIGYPVVTLGFGVKSYVSYRIRHRKQREVAKENEFFMQLLKLALPKDDPANDELLAQIRQPSELLHSATLGEIDLPVSSAIIAQRIQQQQLLLVSNALQNNTPTGTIANPISTPMISNIHSTTSTFPQINNHKSINSNGNSSSKQMNGHPINGFASPVAAISSSTLSSSSSTSSSSSSLSTAAAAAALSSSTSSSSSSSSSSLSSAMQFSVAFTGAIPTTNIPTNCNHMIANGNSNNNNMNSNNLNLSSSHNNGFAFHTHLIGGTTSTAQQMQCITSASVAQLTYRNRRSNDRNDPKQTDPIESTVHLMDEDVDEPYAHFAITRSLFTMMFQFVYKALMAIYMSISKTGSSLPVGEASAPASTSPTATQASISEPCTTAIVPKIKQKLCNLDTDYSHIDSEAIETNTPNTNSERSVHGKIENKCYVADPLAYSAVPTTPSLSTTNAEPTVSNENVGHYSSNSDNKLISKPNGSTENDNLTSIDTNNLNHNSNAETSERTKGRRNRGKQKEPVQPHNHHHHHHHHHHQQQQQQQQIQSYNQGAYKDSQNSLGVVRNPSPLPAQSLGPCEACGRFELEMKKLRSDISHLKQSENELRQKCDQGSIIKSCLQVKQKENDELEKRLQELTSARQSDRQCLHLTERKLTEERRQKQSLEIQLTNERKQRKLTEDKLSRIDCSENCKARKQMLENECKQLRRDLATSDDMKKSMDQQKRNLEQELRKLESELRSRETRESTEVIMAALQAMQEKNATLEKSLSAETRVKLDLFSALGEAKRQLEIRDSIIRQKEKDVIDLKSKVAQMYAVMPSVPNDYLPQCSSSGSMLRLSEGGRSSPLSHNQAETLYTPKNDVRSK